MAPVNAAAVEGEKSVPKAVTVTVRRLPAKDTGQNKTGFLCKKNPVAAFYFLM